MRWTTGGTTGHNLGYHILVCPTYPRPVLRGGIRERLIGLFGEMAGEMGVTSEALEGMTDQVHLFVKAWPVLALHFIMGQLIDQKQTHLQTRKNIEM